MIATARVCEISGLAPTTLADWVAKRLVTPAVTGAVGRGHSHRFTVTQAVGIAVAAALVKSERGCSLNYVRSVVNAFAAESGDWLREQFAKGRTHFNYLHHDKPLLLAQQPYELVDVEAIYQKLKAVPVAV